MDENIKDQEFSDAPVEPEKTRADSNNAADTAAAKEEGAVEAGVPPAGKTKGNAADTAAAKEEGTVEAGVSPAGKTKGNAADTAAATEEGAVEAGVSPAGKTKGMQPTRLPLQKRGL